MTQISEKTELLICILNTIKDIEGKLIDFKTSDLMDEDQAVEEVSDAFSDSRDYVHRLLMYRLDYAVMVPGFTCEL